MNSENMTFSAVSIGHDAEFQRHIDDIYTAMGSRSRREATARLAVFIDSRQRQAGQQAPDTATLQFLTDVVTAAGLLSYGKADKGLANRISSDAYAMRAAMFAASPPSESTARDLAPDEAAALFPQPHMEYFGENIQASIRALKSTAPTLAGGEERDL